MWWKFKGERQKILNINWKCYANARWGAWVNARSTFCANKTKHVFVTARVGKGKKAAKTREYLERQMGRWQRNNDKGWNQLWSRYSSESKRLTCKDPERGAFQAQGEWGGRFGKSDRRRGENQAIPPFFGTWTQSESMITHLKNKNKNICFHNTFVSSCYRYGVAETRPESMSRKQQTRLLQVILVVLDHQLIRERPWKAMFVTCILSGDFDDK